MLKVLIFFTLLISQVNYAQDDFIKKVKNTKRLNYVVTNPKYQNTETNKTFLVDCEKNWYNSRINLINHNKANDTIKTISCSNKIKIEVAFIKGRKEILPKFYGRAEIQKWTFTTNQEAENAKSIIEEGEQKFGARLEKAPWDFWVEKNCLYIILTAGQYMIDDLALLKKILSQ